MSGPYTTPTPPPPTLDYEIVKLWIPPHGVITVYRRPNEEYHVDNGCVLTGITSTSGAVIGATSAGAAIGTVTVVGIGGAAGAVVGLVFGSMAKCFYTKCIDGP